MNTTQGEKELEACNDCGHIKEIHVPCDCSCHPTPELATLEMIGGEVKKLNETLQIITNLKKE